MAGQVDALGLGHPVENIGLGGLVADQWTSLENLSHGLGFLGRLGNVLPAPLVHHRAGQPRVSGHQDVHLSLFLILRFLVALAAGLDGSHGGGHDEVEPLAEELRVASASQHREGQEVEISIQDQDQLTALGQVVL